MALFRITDKSNYLLKFDLNCDVSLANAIRRTILTDVPTAGFKTEPYEESDVKIIENTSSLHNEFLSHRIGMTPLYVENVNNFDPEKYLFKLDIHNKSTKTIHVTTNDFKIINKDTNGEIENSNFFKPNEITNDFILLIKLKPNPDGDGEKINIEAKASVNSGELNSRYSPVSCVTYTNKIDEEKYKKALKEYLESKKSSDENPEDLERHFEISEKERHFVVDENDRPNQFEFRIESVGVLPSHLILISALEKLFLKLKKFLTNFDDAINTKNNQVVSFNKSTGVMESMDIVIQDETHTLGYLLQSYIQLLNGDKVKFIGYRNPHPLKKFIELNISVGNNDIQEIKNVIYSTCNEIIQLIKKIKLEVENEYNIATKKKKLVIKSQTK